MLRVFTEAPVGTEHRCYLLGSITPKRFLRAGRCRSCGLGGKASHLKSIKAPGSDLCANDAAGTSSHQRRVTCHLSSVLCFLSRALHLLDPVQHEQDAGFIQSRGFSTSKHSLLQMLNFFILPDYSPGISFACFVLFFLQHKLEFHLPFFWGRFPTFPLTRTSTMSRSQALMEKLERIKTSHQQTLMSNVKMFPVSKYNRSERIRAAKTTWKYQDFHRKRLFKLNVA